MSDQTIDILMRELYRAGQIRRDNAWEAFVATLERLEAELRSSESFAGDFAHVMARAQIPDPGPAYPLRATPPPIPPTPHHAHQTHQPPLHAEQYESIPGLSDADLAEAWNVWTETFGRPPKVPGRPSYESGGNDIDDDDGFRNSPI